MATNNLRHRARIQFPEDSAWFRDMPVDDTFKTALGEAVRLEAPDRLLVRCSVTRDAGNALRFLCKIDIAADASASGPAGHAWSWWSPLVETPEALLGEVQRALHLRRDRLRAARDEPAVEAGAADRARGLAHGTFATELWDLGRRERAEGFCRNRRGGLTRDAAERRPLRPRYPR